MKKLIRKTWPKVRMVTIKNQQFYRVDARRSGTSGRQETFKSQKEAEKRAGEIAIEFGTNGKEGLSFPAELRGMALAAEKKLRPYGKTLLQAADFYVAHLQADQQRRDSALASALAQQWYDQKRSGKTKQLRDATLKGIQETAEMIKRLFADRRILDITTSDINRHLDNLEVGLRRKFNVRSRFSQFFNWCIAHGHLTINPCERIKIHVGGKDDVTIFSPAEAFRLLSLCRNTPRFKDLVLYHAISLFGGLRPSECQLLTWENIHQDEENMITVLGTTSKTKETRNVPIERNLSTWLKEFTPKNPGGFVTPQKNLIQRLKTFHAALGYKVGDKNTGASTWPQDVMRHSYGSYWLAKHKQRAVLAEHMGNSVEMIKRHYKRVVSNAARDEYWRITPTYDGQTETVQQVSDEEASRNRAKRLAAVVAED